MSEPASSRFTAWFSAEERELLHALAVELGSSDNYVVRMALRAVVGLPVSAWARERRELVERELRLAPSPRRPTHPAAPEMTRQAVGR